MVWPASHINQATNPAFKSKGRIRLLEDTQGTGRYDKSTIFAENLDCPVAVCCWDGGDWVHLSTGVIGRDRRYVLAIGSMHTTDDVTARNTITQAVKTMFPGGRI